MKTLLISLLLITLHARPQYSWVSTATGKRLHCYQTGNSVDWLITDTDNVPESGGNFKVHFEGSDSLNNIFIAVADSLNVIIL